MTSHTRSAISRPLTPLGTGYALVLIFLGIILGLGHGRPALAYPETGPALAVALLATALLAGLVALRGRLALDGLFRPALVFTMFAVWGWVRTAWSAVPTDGAAEVGMLAEGLALFWIGAFVVRGGAWLDAGLEPVVRKDEGRPRAGKAGSRKVGASSETAQNAQAGKPAPPPLDSATGERAIALFFSILAVLVSAHAILQYHYLFARNLEALRAAHALDPADPLSDAIAYALATGRPGSWFGNANVLCGFLAMCVPFAATAGEGARGPMRPAVLGFRIVALCLMAYAAWLTGSRGGAIVFVLALGLVAGAGALFRARRIAIATTLLGIWGVVSIVSLCPGDSRAQEVAAPSGDVRSSTTQPAPPATPNPQLATRHSQLPTPDSVLRRKTIVQRLYYVRSGMKMWKESLLTGHGFGAYGRLYPRARIPGAQETRYAHNFVVQLGVETGLVGLALFGWFVLEAAFAAGRLFRSRRAAPPQWALGGAALLFLADSLGEYTFFVPELFEDFALIAGALCAARPGEKRLLSEPQSGAATASVAGPYNTVGARVSWALPGLGVVMFGLALWRVTIPNLAARDCAQQLDAIWDEMRARERGRLAGPELPALGQEALSLANSALGRQPANPSLWQKRAAAYATLGQIDAAARDLRQAIALNPASASAHAALARLELRLGRPQEAVVLIDRAVALHPLEPDHRLERARILEAVGRRDEALTEAREAKRLAMNAREHGLADALLRDLGIEADGAAHSATPRE